MGEPASEERRKKPRVLRRLPVRFGTESDMRGGMVLDISEGGLRVEAPDPFPVTSLLTVFVQFPRSAIRLRARVAWAGSGTPLMGLAFTQAEPNLTRMYASWLAEVKQASKEVAEAEGDAPAPPATEPAVSPSTEADAAAAPEAAPSRPKPPQGTVSRRVETMRGQTYDLLMERIAGEWYLTVHQVPRQPGVEIPDLEERFPDYESADSAMREFLKTH